MDCFWRRDPRFVSDFDSAQPPNEASAEDWPDSYHVPRHPVSSERFNVMPCVHTENH